MMPSNGHGEVLRIQGLVKDLPLGKVSIHVLRGLNMVIQRGEKVAIIGPSGSGKSTLLGLMGGLDSPTEGRVFIDGQDITVMNESQLAELRNEKIGFVFQFFNLIPTLTALENVALPIQFAPCPKFSPEKRARELLDLLGLKERLKHRPAELSGGEQQRVAIARALANAPAVILADEPTGNLDTASGEIVLQALDDVQRETGTTIVLVTHDPSVAGRMDRVLRLVDGCLVDGNGNGVGRAS